MATFFGSEALIEYTAFSSSVTSNTALYTVPAGCYAEIYVQRLQTFAGTGAINGNYRFGIFDSVSFSSFGPTTFDNLSVELFSGQTFQINITAITGTANLGVTWRVKLYAAP